MGSNQQKANYMLSWGREGRERRSLPVWQKRERIHPQPNNDLMHTCLAASDSQSPAVGRFWVAAAHCWMNHPIEYPIQKKDLGNKSDWLEKHLHRWGEMVYTIPYCGGKWVEMG